MENMSGTGWYSQSTHPSVITTAAVSLYNTRIYLLYYFIYAILSNLTNLELSKEHETLVYLT